VIRRLASIAAAALVAGCAPGLLHEDHPLAGKAWDVRAGRFVEPAAVWARAAEARHVLLGEIHDNPEHHRLQRRALEALASRGARVLAMEHFDTEHQPAMDAAFAKGADAEALADAGRFDREGWGWHFYRPLVEFAVPLRWPVLAANLSRKELRSAVADPARIAALPAPPAGLVAALEQDMVDGHCGHRPDPKTLSAMVNGQRLRDARMAAVLDAASGSTVLVAGNGHVRRDRGVPLYLAKGDAFVVGQVEVRPGATDPREYLSAGFAGAGSYDVVFFSARAEREDPCAAFLSRRR
jgi:uncharacterized iron-regulated protein